MAPRVKTPGRRKVDEDGLTDKEARFVREYLKDFNAARAYMRAYPATTSTSAYQNANRVKYRPKVLAYIKREMDERQLTNESVLDKVRQFLHYDVRDLFVNGELKPMEEWPEDAAASVIGFKQTGLGPELKFVDKVAALEKAMKFLGLFERDNAQQGEAIRKMLEGGIQVKLVRPDGTSSS